MDICTETVGPVWKSSGEMCACSLPSVHVFDSTVDAHRCTCGAEWYDIEQVGRDA